MDEFPYYTTPQQVTGLNQVEAIAAGRTYVMALTTEKKVLTWGHGGEYELGLGTDHFYTLTPSEVLLNEAEELPLTNVAQIAKGYFTSLALTADGKVYAWGKTEFSLSGSSAITATEISGVNDAISITSSPEASFGFVKTGTGIFGWGENTNGQLGIGNKEKQTSPILVSSLVGKEIEQIDVGRSHVLILISDGSIWGAGSVVDGKLTGSGGVDNLTFFKITSFSDGTNIFAENDRSFVVRGNGSVWAWGDNLSNSSIGFLGVGYKGSSYAQPMQMLTLIAHDTSPQPVENVAIEVIENLIESILSFIT